MKQKLGFAAKIWGFYLTMLLLVLVFTSGISNNVVRIILDGGLWVAFLFLSFSEGGYRGEKGVTLTHTIEKQEKEGRRVLDELRPQVYNRKMALVACLIAALPLLTVSALNAAYYPVYRLDPAITEAADVPAIEDIPAAEDAPETENAPETEEAAEDTEIPRSMHWARVTAWIVMAPFSTINRICSDAVNAALFFLYSLLLPGAALVGYWCGPKLYERKIKMMKKGSRRKKRGLLVNRPNRTNKPPKAEV